MKNSRTTRISAKSFQSIVHEYHALHGNKPYDMRDVAVWARNTGRIKPAPLDEIKLITRDLRRAMRMEKIRDAQGRDVRCNHAVRVTEVKEGVEVQRYLWDDMRTAKPGHMRLSLSQRRDALVFDCKQHRTDTESYNDNNRHGASIPLFDYNINLDLDEMDRPTDYPDSRPEDDKA